MNRVAIVVGLAPVSGLSIDDPSRDSAGPTRRRARSWSSGHRAGSRLRVANDRVAGLLGDHVNRRHDEEAGDAREDRRVDHPEPLRALDLEVGVEDRVLEVACPPDPAGPAGVLATRLVPGPLGDVGVALDAWPG